MTVERGCDSTSEELGDHGKGDLRDAAEHSRLYDGGGKHSDSVDRITRIQRSPFHNDALPDLPLLVQSEIKKVRSLTAIPCTAGVTNSSVQQIQ